MFFDSGGVHPYGSFWLDVADKGIKGVAVIIAGVWTAVNFERSRTFERKLEPSVSGEIFEHEGHLYISVSTSLKNVGQSKYTITQTGTAVEALKHLGDGWERISVSTVFADHAWIEPGERIEDRIILALPHPAKFVAIKLILRVVSRVPKATEWNCSCIVRRQTQGEKSCVE